MCDEQRNEAPADGHETDVDTSAVLKQAYEQAKQDAAQALERLQALVSGSVDAWSLRWTEVERYKFDLRRLPKNRRTLAEIQSACAGCQVWFDKLPTEAHRRAANGLLKVCHARCQTLLRVIEQKQAHARRNRREETKDPPDDATQAQAC